MATQVVQNSHERYNLRKFSILMPVPTPYSPDPIFIIGNIVMRQPAGLLDNAGHEFSK